jgi:prepilin-type N-terminal cleavage/methylation domain-containing protein
LRPSDERGFTLVEAMVALVILTIGLVSLAELLAVTLRLQQLGRNEASAVRLADDLMDQLRSLNFDLAPTVQIGGSLTANVANYNDTVPGYRRRWLVEAGPASAAGAEPNLRLVTIRVIPDVADNRTASTYQLVSIIHRW